MQVRRHLLEMVAGWDTPTRLALSIAVALLAVMLGLLQWGGEALRNPALIATMALTAMIQVLVLWGNRHMVTPFTRAQRHYQRGEFDRVLALLVPEQDTEKPDVGALTLLGNTYRQLSRLDESAAVLEDAIRLGGHTYFPVYGYGRTLLVRGEFDRAAAMLTRALEAGAPSVTRVELAEAQFHAGEVDAARATLAAVDEALDPARQMMAALINGQPSGTTDEAVAFWDETARRFADTPYGAALNQLVGTAEPQT